MTKRERIYAAIARQPVDRMPCCLWYHFRLNPPAGAKMAKSELDFYRKYDPDLLKVMHDVPYEMPEDMDLVKTADDWDRLTVLDGIAGNFGQQLETIRLIREGVGDDVPVIDTVFGIFSTAQKVTGGCTLDLLRNNPDKTHLGLRKIALSLGNYAKALMEAGADGIFLAQSGAASDTMTAEEYRNNFLDYDKLVLSSASEGTVNVLHQHGQGIYPQLGLGLSGYQIYSWSNRLNGNPGMREMRVRTQLCLMAGVNETTFATDEPARIVSQIKDAVADTQGIGMIAAPGCSIPTPPASPDENLRSIRAGVEG